MAFARVVEGVRWRGTIDGRTGGVIEYSFWTHVEPGEQPFSGPLAPALQAEVRRAFATWSAVANIDFREVSDSYVAHLGGIRLGMITRDGPGNVLAATLRDRNPDNSIRAAQIGVDNAEQWRLENGQVVNSAGVLFYQVMLHEIGHALGLAHYDGAPSVMNTAANNLTTLQASDIEGIQAIYGLRPPPAFNPETLIPGSATGTTTFQDVTTLPDGSYIVTYQLTFENVGYSHYSNTGALLRSATDVAGNFNSRYVEVAALGDGGYMVGWSGPESYVHVFNADGTPRGAAIRIASTVTDYSSKLTVTELVDGGVAVMDRGRQVRTFDEHGVQRGAYFDQAPEAANSMFFELAGLTTGNFVTVWSQQLPGGTGANIVQGRLFDGLARPVAAAFTIASGTDVQIGARVVGLRDGGFLTFWSAGNGQLDIENRGNEIMARRFDASGNPVGASYIVNQVFTGMGNQFGPDAVVLPDGRIVVAWQSSIGDILARVLDPNGNPVSAEITVNTLNQAGAQVAVSLDVLQDGRVVFSWKSSDHNYYTGGTTWQRTIDFGITGPVTHYGTSAGELIYGGGSNDLIAGGGGRDIILTRAGDDFVIAGEGDDGVDAGAGNDTIVGEGGNDGVYAGDGNDAVAGGNGNDALLGNAGADVLFGGNGADTLYGEDGDDVLWGEDQYTTTDGADTMDGGNGNDTMLGQGGNDVLSGGAGNDAIAGGNGIDILYGGAGADTLFGEGGIDLIYGGPGGDVLKGGLGGDLYSYNYGDGGDYIMNFNEGGTRDGIDLRPWFDQINYTGTNPRAIGALVVVQNGADTDIYVTGSFLCRLANVTAAAIDDSYFLFQ